MTEIVTMTDLRTKTVANKKFFELLEKHTNEWDGKKETQKAQHKKFRELWNHWVQNNRDETLDFSNFIFDAKTKDLKLLFFKEKQVCVDSETMFPALFFNFKAFHFPYANFDGTIFTKEADFTWSTFIQNANFVGVEFTQEINFACSVFTQTARFICAKFRQNADFSYVTFKGSVFHNGAIFSNANFMKNAYFGSATFTRGANFSGVTIKSYLIGNFNNVDFTGIKYRYTLAECLIIFLAELSINILHGFNFVKSIKKLKAKLTPSLFERCRVEGCYGSPMFKRFAQDQAYIAEFKRNHPIWAWLWWIFTGYGKSLILLSFWIMVIGIMFAGFYAYLGPNQFSVAPLLEINFISMIYYSIVTLTTLGFGDITPITSISEILVMIEVVLGYGFLGLLISILANKVARRS